MLLDHLFDPTPSDDTTIACDPSKHTQNELEQHDVKVEGLLSDRREVRKVEGGYAFRFPGSWEYAERILDVVRYERKCCPFLTFEVAFEPEARGIWLYIGGDEDVDVYLQGRADDLER